MSYGVGRRQGSDLVLLWLWCSLAAAAPISLESSISCRYSPKKKKVYGDMVFEIRVSIQITIKMVRVFFPDYKINAFFNIYGKQKPKEKMISHKQWKVWAKI